MKNTSIALAAFAALSTAHAGFYTGASVGMKSLDTKASIEKATSGTTSFTNLSLPQKKNGLLGGLLVGYNRSFGKIIGGLELSLESASTSKKTHGITGDGSFIDIFSQADKPNFAVTVKQGLTIGFMPTLSYAVNDKFTLGFGLKINTAKFSVHGVVPDYRSADWAAAQSKRLYGTEPTLMASYNFTQNISARLSIGYSMYQRFLSNDMTLNDGNTISVSIKPRTINTKASLVYSF